MYNIIIPLYSSYLYCVASYYDFYKNKKYYCEYKDLKDKLDMLFINVFVFMPLSLFIVLCISPITDLYNSLTYEVFMILIEVLFGEIWFYSLHKIAHLPQFYFLHKRHHEVIKTTGCLALYASPFDAIIINLGSIFIIQIIFGNSLLHNMLVGSYAVANTIINAHSGRKYLEHQLHHEKFKYNYGLNVFMDKLFDTYMKV
jgi:sterol desaturase/sphingolipid hydroxylase (fatty acid hydroxylase superfamily)